MRESLLRKFEVYHTRHVDESREKTGRLMRSHRLLPLDRQAEGFEARHHAVSLGQTSLHYITYGTGDSRVVPGPLDFYVALMPLSGHCVVIAGRERLTISKGTAALVSPDDGLSMLWSRGCEQLMLKIPRETVTSRLELARHDRVKQALRFRLGMDLRSGPGRELWTLVRRTVADLDAGMTLLRHKPVISAVEQSLTTALLYAQPHTYSDELSREAPGVKARLVRSVVAYIRDSDEVPTTIAELTALAGVADRTLRAWFLEEVGMPPMQYVRLERMRRVHEELLRADPETGTTLTEIATRHGVSHLGRFARSYRDHFGEYPSVTRRRRLPVG